MTQKTAENLNLYVQCYDVSVTAEFCGLDLPLGLFRAFFLLKFKKSFGTKGFSLHINI